MMGAKWNVHLILMRSRLCLDSRQSFEVAFSNVILKTRTNTDWHVYIFSGTVHHIISLKYPSAYTHTHTHRNTSLSPSPTLGLCLNVTVLVRSSLASLQSTAPVPFSCLIFSCTAYHRRWCCVFYLFVCLYPLSRRAGITVHLEGNGRYNSYWKLEINSHTKPVMW
jgi:hypothetical protein